MHENRDSAIGGSEALSNMTAAITGSIVYNDQLPFGRGLLHLHTFNRFAKVSFAIANSHEDRDFRNFCCRMQSIKPRELTCYLPAITHVP